MEGMNERLVMCLEMLKQDTVVTKQMYDYLDSIGLDAEYVPHMKVLEAALLLHYDRTQTYGPAWKDFGVAGNALNLARKGKRAWSAVWSLRRKSDELPSVFDDALDCINYAAFMIRCGADRNLSG